MSASVGLAQLPVFRKLRVAIFSTGDELREPGEALTDGANVGARPAKLERRAARGDAQSVDVVLVVPEQGVGDEVIAYFVAAVVEDLRSPVGVLALTRIGSVGPGPGSRGIATSRPSRPNTPV